MQNGKPTNVNCQRCDWPLYRRDGNTLIAFGIALELKRTHTIECRHCGSSQIFSIDRQSESVLRLGRKLG